MGSVVSAKADEVTSSSSSYSRGAYHAGSWYEDDAEELGETLEGYLQAASNDEEKKKNDTSSTIAVMGAGSRLRALIVPHAGYSYSGPTAAYAYHALRQELCNNNNDGSSSPIRRILVLHPSHHVYLKNGCAVSGAVQLETPVGNLKVDDELRQEILALSSSSENYKFSVMEQSVDEHEHSGEMQYPYLAHILNTCNNKRNIDDISVLPIMCGALDDASETAYGALLSKITARPDVCTIVSTDFCHWGSRFSYSAVPSDKNMKMPIYKFIEQLDRRGMDLIQMQQPGAFAEYMKETRNTICGRHAVAVWLRATTTTCGRDDHDDSNINNSSNNNSNNNNNDCLNVQFVRYAQSSAATTLHDSSVSYAAAVATTT